MKSIVSSPATLRRTGSRPRPAAAVAAVRRPKGALNKTTTLLKDAIIQAATAAGGDEDGLVKYLTIQAVDNPSSFLPLLGKVLPIQVQGDAENPIGLKIVIGGD